MSDLHAVDVRLADLRFDDHPIELRQLQDHRNDLRSHDGLTFLRQHGDDFSVDRRENFRVGYIGGLGLDSAARLRNLRVERGEARLVRLALRVGRLYVPVRRRGSSDETVLPLRLQSRFAKFRDCGAFLGLEIGELRLRFLQRAFGQHGIDLGQEIAGANMITQLHFQRFDLAGGSRSDIDLTNGLQCSRGQNDVLQIGARRSRG